MKRVLLAMSAVLVFVLSSWAQPQVLETDSSGLGASITAAQPSDSGIMPETGRRHHRHHHHHHHA